MKLEEKAKALQAGTSIADYEQISVWARPYISLAFQIGFLQGNDNGNGTLHFRPQDAAERQALARLAYEFIHNRKHYTDKAAEISDTAPSQAHASALDEALTAANAAIAALPGIASLSKEHKVAVEAAREKVNAARKLGAKDRDFTNLAHLADAEKKIEELFKGPVAGGGGGGGGGGSSSSGDDQSHSGNPDGVACSLSAGEYTGNRTVCKNISVIGPENGIAVLHGTLFLDPGPDGELSVRNIKADEIKVLSGAANSIHLLANTAADKLEISAIHQDHAPRIVTSASTVIGSTYVQSQAILQSEEGSFGGVNITSEAAGSQVQLEGKFAGHITVSAPSSSIVIEQGASIEQVTVSGEGTTLNIAQNAVVSSIRLEASQSAIHTNGTIKSIESKPSSAVTVTGSTATNAKHAAIQAAVAAIANLPRAITLDDKAAVESARRKVYGAISLGAVNADISNLNVLVAAEAVIASLENSDAPTVQDSDLVTTADTPLKSAFLSWDPNGEALTYEVLAGPAHGTVTPDTQLLPTFTYTPAAGYTGADSFTYRAYDGKHYSRVATVTLQVNPGANHAPYVSSVPFGAYTKKNRPVNSRIYANDEDREPVKLTILNQPTLGTLDIDADTGFFTFTPKRDAVGSETLWVHAFDGKGYSPVAGMIFKVSDGPDRPPVAEDFTVHTKVNEKVNFTFKGSDPEGNIGTVMFLTFPKLTNGIGTNGLDGTYTPYPDAAGTDTILYQLYDGTSFSNIATLTVEVGGVDPDAPTVQDSDLVTTADTPLKSAFLSWDPNGEALTYEVLARPAHGTVTPDTQLLPTFTYTPAAGYTGADSFTYRAYDGKHYSRVATVTLQVNPGGNHAPYVSSVPFGAYTKKNRPVNSRIYANDEDREPVKLMVLNQPTLGTLDIDADTGFFTFTPKRDAVGSETLWVHAFDGKGYSPVAGMIFKVSDGPDGPPVAEDFTVHTKVNEKVNFTFKGSDPEGNIGTVMFLTFPKLTNGIGTNGLDGTYTPYPDAAGTDTILYQLYDGTSFSNIATLTVEVGGVDPDAPTVQDSDLITMEGMQIESALLGRDPNGDVLTYRVVERPTHGSVALDIDNLTFIYKPEAGYTGADHFKYQAFDGRNYSGAATVTIEMKAGASPAPDAKVSLASTKKSRPVKGRIMTSDPDNDPVELVVLNQPTLGTLDLDTRTGFFTFTPKPDAVGNEYVWYHAYDGHGYSRASRMRITIDDGPNQPPEAENVTINTQVNTPVKFKLKVTDPDSHYWNVLYLGRTTNLTGGMTTTGIDVDYTPAPGATGTETILYQVSDGVTLSNVATLTIIIGDDPDGPPDQPGPTVFPQVQSFTHNVALKKDGSVWTWGYNGSGQLGLGDSNYRTVPTEVKGPIEGIRFKQVDAGTQFTLALTADQTVWGWGQNNSGELGDGTTTRRYTPVQAKDPLDPSGFFNRCEKDSGRRSRSALPLRKTAVSIPGGTILTGSWESEIKFRKVLFR
ncbi:Ig-like domain-containing protein [Paenibacillus sp. P25]|nr:Ig-like domain-containing protein [Paenibacillus sp. P25]